MDAQTYKNAIAAILNDKISFMFSSHATKRERQLLKFRNALEIDAAIVDLCSVQFCDNSYIESIEARKETETILRTLAKRIAQNCSGVKK